MHKPITKCRICGNDHLIPVVNLGNQYLTGIFPKSKEQVVTAGPLELVKCAGDAGKHCGLLQLKHSYDLDEMYGVDYGYRSGLNSSMVQHLHAKVRKILGVANLAAGDLVIDIGSNDSTLLQGYPDNQGLILTGIDPTGKKFNKYYPERIGLLPNFFSAHLVKEVFGTKKAKVITSIAMFYDLESPMTFMQEIYDVLADDGLWIFEQSYMPTMLRMNAYDTICHEHLEYYGLCQIKWMTDLVGLKIVDVELNDINGGSFSVMVAKKGSSYQENTELVSAIITEEQKMGLGELKPYLEFSQRILAHREEFISFIREANQRGETIFGYGASTKGNVLLQYCNISPDDISCIAEVNQDKFGSFTPGTFIPIIPEDEARRMNPDYFLVLPWHFRNNIIPKEQQYLQRGGKLVFPLPSLQVVGR